MTDVAANHGKVKVLLAVTGGVAAFKAVDLASKLTSRGFSVKVVMTDNACELIGPKSFEAVTNNAVHIDLWGDSSEYSISHINLAEWADVIAVVPATANIIGKVANGICDDLTSTVLCACWEKKKLMAPAMNNKMWSNPAVKRNIEKVKEMGYELIGPEVGRLACGTEGIGRLTEPDDIIEAIERITGQSGNS